VRLLLDSHLLLWAALFPNRLSGAARALLMDPSNALLFSAASIWEIAIKATLGRGDLRIDPRHLLSGLLANGYLELPVTGRHTLGIEALPLVHKDPFDRLLLAQAISEGIVLLTSDAQLAEYPGPVRLV
jgi:PIN domain nuclease of toxin-antitoxin system